MVIVAFTIDSYPDCNAKPNRQVGTGGRFPAPGKQPPTSVEPEHPVGPMDIPPGLRQHGYAPSEKSSVVKARRSSRTSGVRRPSNPVAAEARTSGDRSCRARRSAGTLRLSGQAVSRRINEAAEYLVPAGHCSGIPASGEALANRARRCFGNQPCRLDLARLVILLMPGAHLVVGPGGITIRMAEVAGVG